MKSVSVSSVTQSCPTLSDPMDYSLPGSSVHGIFQARVLEWGAIAFSRTITGRKKNNTKQKMRLITTTSKVAQTLTSAIKPGLNSGVWVSCLG